MKHAATFALLCGGALLTHAAAAQTYTFKTSKAPMSGSTIFWATNNGGATISEVSASGSTACTLVQGSTKTPIVDPNTTASNTTCYGVSNGGVVVGFYQVPGQAAGVSAGFSYSNGTYTDFVVPSASVQMGGTQLGAISTNGLFAGTYADDKGFQHVFRSHGSPTSLEPVVVPNQHYPFGVGVNNSGVTIVQTFDGNSNYTGSYYVDKGTVTQISYPGATQTVCHDVNNNDDVACHYADTQGLQHGFVYHGASNTYSANIDPPTDTGGTLLIGINDSGRLVGATKANPQTSIRLGLIATPSAN